MRRSGQSLIRDSPPDARSALRPPSSRGPARSRTCRPETRPPPPVWHGAPFPNNQRWDGPRSFSRLDGDRKSIAGGSIIHRRVQPPAAPENIIRDQHSSPAQPRFRQLEDFWILLLVYVADD